MEEPMGETCSLAWKNMHYWIVTWVLPYCEPSRRNLSIYVYVKIFCKSLFNQVKYNLVITYNLEEVTLTILCISLITSEDEHVSMLLAISSFLNFIYIFINLFLLGYYYISYLFVWAVYPLGFFHCLYAQFFLIVKSDYHLFNF